MRYAMPMTITYQRYEREFGVIYMSKELYRLGVVNIYLTLFFILWVNKIDLVARKSV